MSPLFVARRIDAVEAHDRESENVCPMEAVLMFLGSSQPRI
jgi:hypothetical protein